MRLRGVLSFTAAFFPLFTLSNGQSISSFASAPPTSFAAISPKGSSLSAAVVPVTPGSSSVTDGSLTASITISMPTSDCPVHKLSDSLGSVTSYAGSDQGPFLHPSPYESSSSRVTTAGTGLWNFRGDPFIATTTTGVGPALAEHDGWLFALYTNKTTTELYWAQGNNDAWYFPVKFIDTFNRPYPTTVMPALASFGQSLHAVVDETFGDNSFIQHLIFNDTLGKWNLTSTRLFQDSYTLPALASYNGQLFLAMASPKGDLTFTTWTPVAGWSIVRSIPGVKAYGRPAMYVQNNVLYLLFPGNTVGPVLSLVYKNNAEGWSSLTSLGENTYEGVSATSSGGLGFMGFNTADPFPRIFVKVNNGLNWGPHEIPGQSASNTPTLAVLDDVLNLIFDSYNDIREVLWLQRPLTNYSLESWMSAVADNRYISSLSIPGTHDSAAVSFVPFIGTQTMSITEQLNAGIRYLDLRCGLIDNVLLMFHGAYNLELTLQSVVTDIESWLMRHQTEAVIVQIKQDPDSRRSNISFAAAVEKLIGPSGGRWNTSDTLPRLQDIRNHMQLVRRYSVNETAGEKAIGIDLSQGWQDNNPFFDFYTPSGIRIYGQDEYKFDERLDVLVSRKFAVVDALMEYANKNPYFWCINFASATHTFPTGIYPEDIAVGGYPPGSSTWVPGVNTYIRKKLYRLPTYNRYGTILMDYPESPDDDLIARIVADNM